MSALAKVARKILTANSQQNLFFGRTFYVTIADADFERLNFLHTLLVSICTTFW